MLAHFLATGGALARRRPPTTARMGRRRTMHFIASFPLHSMITLSKLRVVAALVSCASDGHRPTPADSQVRRRHHRPDPWNDARCAGLARFISGSRVNSQFSPRAASPWSQRPPSVRSRSSAAPPRLVLTLLPYGSSILTPLNCSLFFNRWKHRGTPIAGEAFTGFPVFHGATFTKEMSETSVEITDISHPVPGAPFATSPNVVGLIYAANYGNPTPDYLRVAVCKCSTFPNISGGASCRKKDIRQCLCGGSDCSRVGTSGWTGCVPGSGRPHDPRLYQLRRQQHRRPHPGAWPIQVHKLDTGIFRLYACRRVRAPRTSVCRLAER